MCGICGVTGPALTGADKESVAVMNGMLTHRGPDEEGYYWDGEAGLGHRRLSIIDLATGRQPIANEDESIFIVYNGEVYNYKELRERLSGMGHRFRTNTDTEAIVHLYEEHGIGAVKMLNGMFAFALWDRKARALVIARDRLGIKPLYYAEKDGKLYFSSELKSLLKGIGGPHNINEDALCLYLLLQYTPCPETIIKGVYKLPPGSVLRVQGGGYEVTSYWRPEEARRVEGGEAGPARLLETLTAAVEKQLVSDVPLGAFLSGGIDSSAVVALMRRFKTGRVKTFSIGFEGPPAFDERVYAREAAAFLGTEHYETVMTPADFARYAPMAVAAMDEPLADPAAVPTLKLSALAREHVTVVMTGEGGDELFGGYKRYMLEKRLGGLLSSPVGRGVAALGRALTKDRRYLKAVGAMTSGGWPEAHLNWVTVFLKDEFSGLTAGKCQWDKAATFFGGRVEDSGDRLGNMMACDLLTWLPDDLLAKVDRMSMAVSLEARVPLLDNTVIDLALSLGTGSKIKGLTTKAALKDALAGVLPEKVIRRRKSGFDVPLSAWFRGPLKEYIESSLEGGIGGGLFLDRGFIRKMLYDHVTGKRDWALPLFSLLVLKQWHEGIYN